VLKFKRKFRRQRVNNTLSWKRVCRWAKVDRNQSLVIKYYNMWSCVCIYKLIFCKYPAQRDDLYENCGDLFNNFKINFHLPNPWVQRSCEMLMCDSQFTHLMLYILCAVFWYAQTSPPTSCIKFYIYYTQPLHISAIYRGHLMWAHIWKSVMGNWHAVCIYNVIRINRRKITI
jgi:hypothetical protein